MKILTINSGSSSLKFKVFNMATDQLLAKGLCERIGLSEKGSDLNYKNIVLNKTKTETIPATSHSEVLDYILKLFIDKDYGFLENIDELIAVGHRVLHGKDVYGDSTLVTKEVIEILKTFIELGPLHMPANIRGIEACMEIMNNKPMVAVFDTSFHQTMPAEAFMYGIPYEYYTNYGIRRYGFHGTSHKYVTQKAAELTNKQIKDMNLITLHLGNGSSITAVKRGKVIDTSMGFTPLEGIMMGTRSGDLDPAIIPFLLHKLNCDWSDIDRILNKKSGLLGLSGLSNDMRDIMEKKHGGDDRAKIAYDVFVYRIIKYIGAYYTAIGEKLDGIIFTAGIGENAIDLRTDVCSRLSVFGVKLDVEKNKIISNSARLISSADSYIDIYVIPTDEELLIAKDTYEIYKKITD
ncbi:acetate kinase [Candidatus Dependentiae bacterium]|nr:acetate kinase [Candidatus Dependentiae bacterium]